MSASPFAVATIPTVDEAKRISEKNLRDNVEAAAGFQSLDKTIYVLALHYPHDGGDGHLTVLRKIGNGYSRIWESEEMYGSHYKNINLKDFNTDNAPEVYYESSYAGTGESGDEFKLIDTSTNTEFTATVRIGNNNGRGSIEYSTNLLEARAKNILAFFQSNIEKSQYFEATQKGPTMVERWSQKYGRFADGGWNKVKIQPSPSPLKSEDCSFLSAYIAKPEKDTNIKIGNIMYIAGFKDAVYAVDLQKSQCFVVYMPQSYYDWIYPLKKDSRNRLVMHDRTKFTKIVYYDPTMYTLFR
jgi:hypothetical protein